MKRIVIFSLFILLSLYSRAQQKTELRGTVADSSSKEHLEMATVTVQDSKDSSLITYTLTNRQGEFKLTGLPANKPVRLLVSYTGYKTYIRTLGTDRPTDIGRIILAPTAKELNTFEVAGNRPPVAIRSDTIEFNASSFKTKPNAVVEDLLKKLPGVDIDDEGNITVNGKKVTRILVDGKEFFSGDPKLATKHLPTNIIDKVQVVDTKTKQEAKMGIQKDGEDRTINLTLKEDKKRGLFGKLSAGGGTDQRFELSGMLNAFNKSRQLSILSSSNNLNKMSFTMSELASAAERKGGMSMSVSSDGAMSVNGISFSGGGEGVRTATMAGYNYNDQWGTDVSVNNSYFFNNTDARFRTVNNRKRLIDNSTILGTREGYNNNASHRVNFGFDIALDSLTQLNINPAFEHTNQSSNTTGNESTRDENGLLVNTNKTANRSNGKRNNFSNGIALTRMLNKKGRSIGFNFSNSYSEQNGYAFNLSDRDFYKNEMVDSAVSTNQRNTSDNKTETYRVFFSYVEPLSKTWKMNLNYTFNYSINRAERRTFNYDPATKDYTELDSTYTNKFRTTNVSQLPSITFNYNSKNKKWNATLGGGLNLNVLDNHIYTTNTTLRQYQTNFQPNSRVSYRLKNNGNLSFNYSGYMQQPTLDQLQPLRDNTNTLNERIGNPDLKPSFSQNFRLGYDRFAMTGFGIFSGIGISPVLNRITTVTKVNAQGGQTTQYVNVGGTYSMNANLSISKSKKAKDYQWRANGGLFANANRSYNYSTMGNPKGDTTLRKNLSMTWMLAPSFNFSYAYKELFDLGFSYRTSYNDVKNTPSTGLQSSYYTHRANLGTTVYWPGNFSWDNDVAYSYNSRTSPGFKKGVMLWNMGLAYDFFKDKHAQVKLSAYDLLRQNTSVRRSITELYIDDYQTDIVEQYFMLTFTYNISKFGAKGKSSRRIDGGRGGGGGIFIF